MARGLGCDGTHQLQCLQTTGNHHLTRREVRDLAVTATALQGEQSGLNGIHKLTVLGRADSSLFPTGLAYKLSAIFGAFDLGCIANGVYRRRPDGFMSSRNAPMRKKLGASMPLQRTWACWPTARVDTLPVALVTL